MVRIVAGAAGGVRLASPDGLATRPTSEKARGALFSSLGDLSGAVFFDLFAGTGAVGLEAASRGAAEVWLVDDSRSALGLLHENSERTRKAGASAPVRILQGDAKMPHHLAPEASGRPMIIFADPPFDISASVFTALLADNGFAAWAGDALLILQLPGDSARRPPPVDSGLWIHIKRRTLGGAPFDLYGKRLKQTTQAGG